MVFGGGSSKPPTVKTSVAPTETSPDLEAAKSSQREKRRRMAGREDTILTPGLLTTARKDQLG